MIEKFKAAAHEAVRLGHNADVGVAKMCDSALGVAVPGVATAAPRISSLPTTSQPNPKARVGANEAFQIKSSQLGLISLCGQTRELIWGPISLSF